MAISFSGLGSGLDTSSWVEALVGIKKDALKTQETKLSSLESSSSALSTVKTSYSSLKTSLSKLTDVRFDPTGGLFSQTKTTSSDETKLTASSTNAASVQKLALTVSQLATSTKVESVLGAGETIGAKVDRDTLFKNLAGGYASSGNFSVYVDNQKYNINITDQSTVGDILDDISNQTGLNAQVVDGKIQISDTQNRNITLGSTSDLSNFYSVMALEKNLDGSYSSKHAVTNFDVSAKILGEDSRFSQTVEASEFKIGNATFTIDADTTMQTLINDINSNADAGVTASWDNVAGKMVLESKQEGSFNVNIENISGNFTDLVGFTTSTYDENTGEVLSSGLKAGSQTLGKIAKFTINGTELSSSSNTVSSDVTGIAGLTFTLKSKTSTDETIPLDVGRDSSSVKSALDTFISAFSTALSQTDTVTGEDGLLKNEPSLTSVRNNLRKMATASVTLNDGTRASLADIGITTGAVGASVDADTDKRVIDEAKL